MSRKRITELFPFLLPLRVRQKVFCYYAKMRFDSNTYAQTIQKEELPNPVCQVRSLLRNEETGFDMVYQENKIHNLKLAAQTVEHLLIQPGETFSFWQRVRHAEDHDSYRDGLVIIDGRLTTIPGGGMCQLSNLLFELFLQTPLTITERTGHKKREFPSQDDTVIGADATVHEGWLDLKVRNDTEYAFQIAISFDHEFVTGRILSSKPLPCRYRVVNQNLHYYRKDGCIYEETDVCRQAFTKEDSNENSGGQPAEETVLFTNLCQICYPLPSDIPVEE